MSRSLTFVVVCAIGLAVLSDSSSFAAATVNYQGYVYKYAGQAPAFYAFAIAGTFAQGFDPYEFNCYYGDDDFCNMGSSHYSEAVADGNFIPIGTGDLTDFTGFFSGSGSTSAPAGTPIFLFVFDTPNPKHAQNWGLATSSHASFAVPAGDGSTTVQTALADSAAYGILISGGIALNGLPIPEPTSSVLAAIGIGALGLVRFCNRIR